MNDFNPYAAPEAPIAEPAPKVAVPQTYREAVKQGAWFGFKWISILMGPIAVLVLLMFWGTFLYEVLKGRRILTRSDQEIWVLFLGPFGLYFYSCLWGVMIGVLASSVGHLVRSGSRRHRM